MHSKAQTIARLKSMAFLVEEALRIADEGDDALLGAKLSDCLDCLRVALEQIGVRAAQAGHHDDASVDSTVPADPEPLESGRPDQA
ncbi:hypothetical protein [Sphingomonas faeni]|uniref:hypothetical protein n=1 Tax=Sphingomonas faeni TaxID=185950 RepID=UPI0020C80B94|nr:hypothetical protein [Sphingomonas faeni]MCP8891269.1 hypothetical protein [Sphingomonas faeni]